MIKQNKSFKGISVLIIIAMLMSFFTGINAAAKSKVQLSASSKILNLNGSFTLKLINGAAGSKINWNISNGSVVSVTNITKNTLSLRAKTAGTATVSATYRYKKTKEVLRCKITVKKPDTGNVTPTPGGSGNTNPPTPTPTPTPEPVHTVTTDLTLYGLDTWATEYIKKIPDSYLQSAQISSWVNGKSTYKILSGCGVSVSDKGVIAPSCTTYYWQNGVGSTVYNKDATSVTKEMDYGKTQLEVQTGNRIDIFNITVCDYAKVFADKKIDAYIASNVNTCRSGLDKLRAICKYAASFNYSADYSSYAGMIVSGGGDCWSSTNLIIAMCDKVKLTAYARNASVDPGAGSGHRNVVVKLDGKYYIADAGYDVPSPRLYTLREYDNPITVDGNTVTSYFGTGEASVKVPEKVDGVTITTIGNSAFCGHDELTSVKLPDTITTIELGAFYRCLKLTNLNIPASAQSIGLRVFSYDDKLENLKFDKNNNNLSYENGVIYDKAKTKVIAAVVTNGTVVIPRTVEEISEYAFYTNMSLKAVTIPSGVKKIEEGTFGDCENLSSVTLNEGLTEIGEYAFAYTYALKSIHIPASVTSIAGSAFYCDENLVKK